MELKKRVENRGWGRKGVGHLDLPNGGCDVWLGLHAAKESATPTSDGGKWLTHLDALRRAWPDMPPVDSMPHSAIIGFFHIREVVSVSSIPDDPQAVGPECWVIDAVIRLPHPIANVRGQLGLWTHDCRVPADAQVLQASAAPRPRIEEALELWQVLLTALDAHHASSASSSSGSLVSAPASSVECHHHLAIAPGPSVASAKRSSGIQMSELERAAAHWKAIGSGFADFQCRCDLAAAAGSQSCLDQFTKVQLRQFFNETYGPKLGDCLSRGDRQGCDLKLKDVSLELHRHLWPLRVPLEKEDSKGRKFSIPRWILEGKEVCRPAWGRARGGANRRLSDLVAEVLRGFGPAERQAGGIAAQELALVRRQTHGENARRTWTVGWWSNELLCHEWAPDEQAVRFRGQGFEFLHTHMYEPAAKAAGIEPYGYTTWRTMPAAALTALHKEGALPGSDAERLRLKRSANHYNAPECTTCAERRSEYRKACSTPGVAPEVAAAKLAALREHMAEFRDDRNSALRIKYATFTPHSDAIYECDDGCGSFWQALPVGPEGRDTKRNATAKYHFGIQANVVCGPGGVQRFAVLPKNVRKGANFGLTNLVVALHRAWKQGRLGPHVRRCYRHTDGGPDNVAWFTHILHWLLVWLGVFDDMVWFRFEAGHSHTEIADRLFGVMKKLFDSGCSRRVGPLETFAELEAQLKETFSKAPELFELWFDFANWDFENWFSTCTFSPSEKFPPLMDSNFGGYAFDHVYRYQYVGEELWQHGGVHITYKHRVSDVGTATEAEWKPIRRATRSVPTQSGGMEEVQVNETSPSGVVFMLRPPDLRHEPRREPLSRDSEDQMMETVCARIRRVRSEDLTEKHLAFWKALEGIHTAGKYADALPHLPHTTTVDGHEFTFTGCPQPLIPMLRDLRRFERPLIPWDPFAMPPPPAFRAPGSLQLPAPSAPPAQPQAQPQLAGPSSATGSLPAAVPWPPVKVQPAATLEPAKPAAIPAAGAPARAELRDPRVANTVTHAEYKKCEQAKDAMQLTLEDWRCNFAGRVESVASDRLYIVRLDEPDGEFKLGLVATEGEPFEKEATTDEGIAETVPHMRVLWFGRKDAPRFGWGKNPAFEPYGGTGAKRVADDLPVESFLLEVADDDLTEAGLASKWTEPKLKETFATDKLRWIAERYGLLVEPPNRERSKRPKRERSEQALKRKRRKKSKRVERSEEPKCAEQPKEPKCEQPPNSERPKRKSCAS